MKRFNILHTLIAIIAVVSLMSCVKEELYPGDQIDKDPNAMIFNAGVSQLSVESTETRSNPLEDAAASAVFNNGDVVAIVMSDNSAPAGYYDRNCYTHSFAKYVYNTEKSEWEFLTTATSDPTPPSIENYWNSYAVAGVTYWGAPKENFVWRTESDAYYFSAYYPVNETTSLMSFTLPTDQSTKDKIASADYMTLISQHIQRPGHNAVNLALQRKTSRVIVEIVKNEATDITFNKDTKVQFISKAEGYEPKGNEYSTVDDETHVTPYYSETPTTDGEGHPTYTALVMPDAASNKTICIFEESGLALFREVDLKEGYSYRFKVSVSKEAGLLWTMTVEPWTEQSITSDIPVETYYIYDEQDMWEFSQLVSKGHSEINGYVVENIDLTKITKWPPIGSTSTSPFKGVFKGVASESDITTPMMRTIKGLDSEDGGLFGFVEDAEISNITLEKVKITSKYDDNVGAFIGNFTNSKVDNCVVYSGSTIVADEQVGGIIGNLNSGHITITNTPGEQTIAISGEQAGSVSGDKNVGGVIGTIGEAGSVTISKVVNASSVSARESSVVNIGGLIGNIAKDNRTDGTYTRISESYNKADASVTGTTYVGGLVGKNESASLILEGSHNAGTVKGTNQTGGLMGSNAGTMVASYNVGNVVNSAGSGASSTLGGLAGNLSATGKIIGCFNAGEVLIKNATPTPGHGEYSTTSHYGHRGDGVVGTADVGATVTNSYFMRGNADATVNLEYFAMTAPALSWYSKGDARDIFMYHRMVNAIDRFYDDASYTGTRYAFFPIQPEGTGSSTLTKEEMQKIPYIGTYTVDDPLSDIKASWDPSSTIRPLTNAQKYSIENVVNVINTTDAGMLVSALSFSNMPGISETDKNDLTIGYSYFYVDVKLHIDIDFSNEDFSGFKARVSGAYFGVFDGNNETILNYNDNKPFFTKISTSDAGANNKYIGAFKNVIFENPTVSEGGDNIGVLLGSADYGTVLENCRVYGGSVKGGKNVGSLIGKSEANIFNCHVTGTKVTGTTNVGGIVGLIELTKANTQPLLSKLENGSVLAFGGSTTSAIVEATDPKGVAGGIAGKASSDMDATNFNVESQGVSFKETGTVTGNIVGSIAGEIEMAQAKLGFHGIENAGTIIATGENPVIGGLVGIGRIIGAGSLSTPSTPIITSLEVYAIAVSNTGAIDPITQSSGSPMIGGMVGKLEIGDPKLTTITKVTTKVDGAFEQILPGGTFVPFIGNKSAMPNLSETFNQTYLSTLPTEGYNPNPFILLESSNFISAMAAINEHLKKMPKPELYKSSFSYDNSGNLIFPDPEDKL